MPKSRAGFTLIELLIGFALLAVAMALIYNIYLSGTKAWESAGESADMQAKARWAMNYMVAELRNATRTSSASPSPNLAIPSHPNNKSIIFCLPLKTETGEISTDNNGNLEWETNNNIHYQYVPGQRMLRRLEKGEQTILSEDVSDVQFIDASIDPTISIYELKVILEMNKTTQRGRALSLTLSAIVRLRN